MVSSSGTPTQCTQHSSAGTRTISRAQCGARRSSYRNRAPFTLPRANFCALGVNRETNMFRNADGVASRSSSHVPCASFAQIIFGLFLAALLGDTVKKGQLLLRVQSADVATAFSEVGRSRKVRGEMTTSRSLAAALPDFHRFGSLDPVFLLTISFAFFMFSATLFLGKSCGSRARQIICRFFILGRSLRHFPKPFRMNSCAIPRFALFYRQFLNRNPFRINTYRKTSEVFILNNLQDALNFLESTLTGKGEGVGCQYPSLSCLRTSPRLHP